MQKFFLFKFYVYFGISDEHAIKNVAQIFHQSGPVLLAVEFKSCYIKWHHVSHIEPLS